MFPIMDENGDVIAFGGRVMDDTKPKYINSPDSQLFSKRTRLYGYPYKAERRSEAIIICEGYMDYIALHSAGYRGLRSGTWNGADRRACASHCFTL